MKDRLMWYIHREICKRLIRSWVVNHNLTKYYAIMREELENKFTEDNDPTLDGFAADHFKKSLKSLTFELVVKKNV